VTIAPPPRARISGSAWRAIATSERLGGLRARDERIGADVDRHPEPVARRIGEATFEILRSGEGDGVDEDVELTVEGRADLSEHAREIVVRSHVALGDERGVDRARKVADALLDALALIGERESRTAVGERLRDRPGDGALVRDAHDERALACEGAWHPGDPMQPRIPSALPCAAPFRFSPAAPR
jgi:hypothetical protein